MREIYSTLYEVATKCYEYIDPKPTVDAAAVVKEYISHCTA